MTVFKGYMVIIKRNIMYLFLYGGIFLFIVMAVQNAASESDADHQYQNASLNIAVIDEDESEFSKGLTEALSRQNSIRKDVTEQGALIKELYYWRLDYVLRIPKDAGERLLDGETVLEVVKGVKSDNSYRSIYADMQVDSYVDAYRFYRNAGLDLTEASQKASEVMDREAEVTIRSSGVHNQAGYQHYFRYLPFVLLYTFCYIFPLVLKNFNKQEIERRMNSSGISSLRQNLQGTFALLVFCTGVYLLLLGLAFILYGKDLLKDGNLGYYLLNTACVTLVAASVSYLIGNCVKNEVVVNGIANIVALGMSFLCGVIVDLDILGAGVRTIAQFLPVYWYETANVTLYEFGTLTAEQSGSVWMSFGIQLAMSAAFLCIALIIKKRRAERG